MVLRSIRENGTMITFVDKTSEKKTSTINTSRSRCGFLFSQWSFCDIQIREVFFLEKTTVFYVLFSMKIELWEAIDRSVIFCENSFRVFSLFSQG